MKIERQASQDISTMWKHYINSHKMFTDYEVGKISYSWDWENCFQENKEGEGKEEKEEGKKEKALSSNA